MFTRLRGIYGQIGSRTQPDEPRLTLAIDTSKADIQTIADTLDQWLANTKSGKVAREDADGNTSLLHIELLEPPRAGYMVDRLIRRFKLAKIAKLYSYNDGRRYCCD
jgi:hypothetical protein